MADTDGLAIGRGPRWAIWNPVPRRHPGAVTEPALHRLARMLLGASGAGWTTTAPNRCVEAGMPCGHEVLGSWLACLVVTCLVGWVVD